MHRQASFSGSTPRTLKSLPRPDENDNLKKVRRTAPPVCPLSPEKINFDASSSSVNNNATSNLNMSRSQLDPFYRHGEEDIVNCPETVTIFGFPRNNIMTVIDDFSVFGKIKNFKLDVNGGNWAHVQYENKLQAVRAKEQHGKIFSGSMLGVTACLDPQAQNALLDQSEESVPAQLSFDSTNSRFGSIRNASVLTPLRERTKVFNSVFV